MFLFGITLNAQTIEKSTVDSGGASIVNGLEVLYTIGEVNVQEVTLGNVSISEGFINGSVVNCNLIVNQSPTDLELFFDGSGNTQEVNTWLNNNGNAVVSAPCGEITWAYEIYNDELSDTTGDGILDRLTIFIEFFVYNDFSESLGLEAKIIFNDFASAGESSGNGGTICQDTFSVSDFDNDLYFDNDGIDYSDSKFNSSTFSMVQTFGKPGLELLSNGPVIKFPDTGSGQFTYIFDFKVETSVTIGSQQPRTYETSTFYIANNVTVAFDPGPNITVPICDFNNIDLLDLYNQLNIQLDVDTTEFNEAEDFGNVFDPETLWYNESDDLESYPNTPPLTEITEPGVYQFNAKAFLQDCAGEPVYVTLTTSPQITQEATDLTIPYDLSGANVEINNWLENNAGAVAISNCGDVTWSYELLNQYVIADHFDEIIESLFCEIEFTAMDSQGEEVKFTSILEITNFPVSGETDQGDVQCGRDYNLLDAGSAPNATSSLYGNSNITATINGGNGYTDTVALVNTNDYDIVFPDTGSGQFFYSIDFTVTTPMNFGTLNFNAISSSGWSLPVTVPFNPGPEKNVNANLVSSLEDLYNQLDVIDDSVDPNNPPFNSDLYWYDEDGNSITAYSGPGVYVFDAEDFLPECGGIPTTVTVLPNYGVLNMKVFLQGPYDATSGLMDDSLRSQNLLQTTSPYADALTCDQLIFDSSGNNAIVDWVWIEFRDVNDNTNILYAQSALLQRDGDIVNEYGMAFLSIDIPDGDYYISLSHRNHLGVLTAQPISYSLASGILVDFSMDINDIFGGSNAIGAMTDGVLALYTGDFNGDGQVQNTDKIAVEALRGLSGYNNADLDMNGQIQNTDVNILLSPNIGKGQQFLGRQLYAKRRD